MTLAKTLHAAASDVGYREVGNNWTVYWERWRKAWQGQPWCAAAVTDWLNRGGELEEFGGRPIFYCPSIEALAKSRGRWFTSPRVGDLVLYSFGAREAIHVGIVEKVNSTTIQTIEGNTSSGAAGSQNNGGGVYRRVRTRSWGIRGYYRPAYDAAPVVASPIPSLPGKATPTNLVVDGDFGPATVAAFRRYLQLPSAGGWDRAAKRALQKWVRVTQDGVVGPNTIRGLQRKIGATADGDWGRNTTKALQRFLNVR